LEKQATKNEKQAKNGISPKNKPNLHLQENATKRKISK